MQKKNQLWVRLVKTSIVSTSDFSFLFIFDFSFIYMLLIEWISALEVRSISIHIVTLSFPLGLFLSMLFFSQDY